MQIQIGQGVLEVVRGDITGMNTDAIVSAANSRLTHGGGVAGAIVRKGGKIIQEESDTWIYARGEVPVGGAAITSAGALPARYVIHAVGPRMGDGDEDRKLMESLIASLKLAEKHKLKSIAFPAISTGIFGYPVERCARIMIPTLMQYLRTDPILDTIVICLLEEEAYSIFERILVKFSKGKRELK